ncbi:protein ENHANCED DOWNY MILDEW 2-like [Oryza glaberrima]|uniref:protein ENHANCED DOWNY MILDEW 2-like n=1 Tax=Oryza glaberrima TaxID=4538 RepID=UPI00224C067F|nr:protein ENHANCED DOWNY MILDEW 2-like [Oryza glaberrima]
MENHVSKEDSKNYKLRMGFVDGHICAICDDGGNLIRCEGACRRYFHRTISNDADFNCETLNMSQEQVESSKLICKNCVYKQHQCFGCGELGSSDMSSGSAEVYQCSKSRCRRFYHPKCLAEFDSSKNPPVFECPLHECFACKNKGEKYNEETCKNKGHESIKKKQGAENNKKMHLALCRRCPIAYHRKCLPRNISSVPKGCLPRKWKTNKGQVFFYCLKHTMVEHLRSATRDHLKFPKVMEEHMQKYVPKREVENKKLIVYVRKRHRGASKKQGASMVEEVDHGTKESDHVQRSRDINLRAHEQTEAPRNYMSDRNTSTGFVLSFALKSLFPLPYPGNCGWLDD